MNELLKQSIAEFIGTFLLITLGLATIAQFVLSQGTIGTVEQIRWGWGLAVAFSLYTVGSISGGHLNPAVTLSFCVVKKLPWKKMVPYMLGQYLGSFFAACFIFIVYYDGIHSFKGGNKTMETAGIFATYPEKYLSVWNGLLDQIVSTGLLVFMVNAVTDPDNMAPAKGYLPMVIGMIVTMIGMTFGLNCGYPINPARDLSPRFFTLIAGWGTQVFSYNDYKYFWIPVVGPYIGGVLGSILYISCIQMRNPFKAEVPRETIQENDTETKNVKPESVQQEQGNPIEQESPNYTRPSTRPSFVY